MFDIRLILNELIVNGAYHGNDFQMSKCVCLKIEMMDEVLQKYGHLTANQLVAKTHKEGTLWYNAAKEHELLEPFTQHECNNSDYQTALSLALALCTAETYRESLDIKQTANILKASDNV